VVWWITCPGDGVGIGTWVGLGAEPELTGRAGAQHAGAAGVPAGVAAGAPAGAAAGAAVGGREVETGWPIERRGPAGTTAGAAPPGRPPAPASAAGAPGPAAAGGKIAARRLATGDPAAALGRGETTTSPGDGCAPTWGQPRKATSALARMNINAAPASNEPDVPIPAR
jgi:hypothetical protein